MDWQTVLFESDGKLLQQFDRIAAKYFPNDAPEAQRVVNDALQKISADDYAKLGDISKVDNPRAFLFSTVTNLVRDASVARYGKCRPPAWVNRMGATWCEVHKLLCCYRQEANQVMFTLRTPTLTERALAAICQQIKAKHVKCGSELSRPQLASYESSESGAEGAAVADTRSATPHTTLETHDLNAGLEVLSSLLLNGAEKPVSDIQARADAIRDRIALEPQQVMVLRLVYQEQKSVSEAAKLLNLKRHVVDYQLKKALEHLQGVFKTEGVAL